MYKKSQDKSFLTKAIDLEKRIQKLVISELEKDLIGINLGLLDGLTGVAYFYTYLYEFTLETKYLVLSESLIKKYCLIKKIFLREFHFQLNPIQMFFHHI